jgi:hypothetical protein
MNWRQLRFSTSRKRQIEELKLIDVELNPYRNMVIEEVATEIQTRFKAAFPPDTTDSFAVFVRGMKK